MFLRDNATLLSLPLLIACAAPDALGAAGALHLYDADRTLANSVAADIAATLGDDATVELGEPSSIAAGQFGKALAFDNVQSDHVAWPTALSATRDLTLKLWADSSAPAGLHDLALRIGGDAGTAFSSSLDDAGTALSGSLDQIWVAQTASTADEAALAHHCPL